MAKFLPLIAIFFPKLIDICTLIYLSLYAILWEEKYKLILYFSSAFFYIARLTDSRRTYNREI